MLLTDKASHKRKTKEKSIMQETLQKEDLFEQVEVKFHIERKYYAAIERVASLECRSIDSWVRIAVIAEVDALLENYDELGKMLSEHLKRKYELKEES